MDVLKAFVNLHEFSDTILVQALRYFYLNCLWFNYASLKVVLYTPET